MPRFSLPSFQPTFNPPPCLKFLICITRLCMRTASFLLLLNIYVVCLSHPSHSSFEYLCLRFVMFPIFRPVYQLEQILIPFTSCNGLHLSTILDLQLHVISFDFLSACRYLFLPTFLFQSRHSFLLPTLPKYVVHSFPSPVPLYHLLRLLQLLSSTYRSKRHADLKKT